MEITSIQPMSASYRDTEGRKIQLWAKQPGKLFGTVIDQMTGRTTYIPFHKIINPCMPGLEIELPLIGRWDLSYQKETGRITIWPHLQAAGNMSGKPSSVEKATQENPWHPPIFPENPSILGHIFRNELGHLKKDIPENRALILQAASKPENLVGVNRFGREYYSQLLPDGTQIWALVDPDHTIVNGGYNRFPIKCQVDYTNPLGWKFTSIKYTIAEPNDTDFRIRIVSNRLLREPSIFQTQESALQTLAARSIQGVGHVTGIISNMFDTERSQSDIEHIFFLPVQGAILLSSSEIKQIAMENARGIFLYGEIPWLSIHFSPEGCQYPVIHSVYQESFIGHIIAFLDYTMKEFVNGRYYSEEFIANWHNNPCLDEAYLRDNMHSFHQYASENGQTYRSFREVLKTTLSSHTSLSQQSFAVSFRIVAKQESIKRQQNFFLIDDSFDIHFSIEGLPSSEEEKHLYELVTKAAEIMKNQMKELLPKLPMYQKHLQALSLINFFSYYYSTLCVNSKLPVFPSLSTEVLPFCPPTFPPLPLSFSERGQIPFSIESFFNSLNPVDKTALFDFIKNKRQEKLKQVEKMLMLALKNYVLKMSADISHLSEDLWHTFSSAFLSKLQALHDNVYVLMNGAAVTRGCKKSTESFSSAVLAKLLAQSSHQFKQAQQVISLIEKEIADKKKAKEPFDKLILELKDTQKIQEQSSHDAFMYKLWFENPVLASIYKKMCIIDLENNVLGFSDTQPRERSYISGGLSIFMQNIETTTDPFVDDLLIHHKDDLDTMDYYTVLKTQKFSPQGKSGIFIKFPFENNSKLSEKATLIPAFYSPKRPLRELEYLAFEAASTVNISLFRKIASKIQDWNFEDPQGVSFVHYAVQFPRPEPLEFLIQQQANIKVKTPHGATPLHFAASKGNYFCLPLLLIHARENINTRDAAGRTPLCTAAQENQLSSVQLLLAEGADPNIPTAQGMTPLFCSIHLDFQSIALEILESGLVDLEYKLSSDGSTALHLSVEKKMFELSKKLLLQGSNPTLVRAQKYTPLHIAARNGWLKGVQLLLSQCPYLDLSKKTVFGATPLDLAALENHKDTYDFLKARGAPGILDLPVEAPKTS